MISWKYTPKRRGFSLIELMVVIAVIAILLAILIPAVQAAREAARRTQCRNNMKQIGLAMLNYESAHRMLPSGVNAVAAPIGFYRGFLASLLPYLDQEPLYNKLNFSAWPYPLYGAGDLPRVLADQEHIKAVTTPIPTFLCPTSPFIPHQAFDGAPWQTTTNPHDPAFDEYIKLNNAYARADYVGINGSSNFPGLPGSGGSYFSDGGCLAYSYQGKTQVRLGMITDGTSNTMMVGEFSGLGPGEVVSSRGGPTMYNLAMWWFDWIDGDHGSWWSTRMIRYPPNSRYYFCFNGTHTDAFGETRYPEGCETPIVNSTGDAALKSSHAGGVFVLLADGSVRFLDNGINLNTFYNLADRGDGKVLGEF